jgi:hypothetical protein
MNTKPIEEARDADLRFSHAALLRAAQRARALAQATGTAIVVSRDGVIEYLRPPPAKTAPAALEPMVAYGKQDWASSSIRQASLRSKRLSDSKDMIQIKINCFFSTTGFVHLNQHISTSAHQHISNLPWKISEQTAKDDISLNYQLNFKKAINIDFRYFLKTLSTLFVLPFIGCATDQNPEKIMVETKDVKTLPDLVGAIRSSAGSYAPQNYDINDIYRALALSFVENAQAIVESGKKIPEEILKRIPLNRKVVAPIYVAITLWGIKFWVPLKIIAEVIILSIYLMAAFIYWAIDWIKTPTQKIT